MKKTLYILIALFCSPVFGATGWYQDYIVISKNGGANNYYWIGGNPGGENPELNGYNFGEDILSLRITGADMKYWSDTQDRTGGAFYYKIMSADGSTQIIAPVEVIWTHSSLGGNNYQGLWSGSIDLQSSLLANTTYQLHIWAKSWGTGQGDSWLSNGGLNYVATFKTDAGLPVQLSSFNASVINKSVNLKWQTATEQNNYGFEVERASNNDWIKIGFVNGNGNSNSPKEYSYTDNSLDNSGKYSYRLKQLDNDGSHEYSSIVEVDYNPVLAFELEQNYPNPFNPVTSISYSVVNEGLVKIEIYNSLGQLVAIPVNEIKSSGRHSVSFDASKMSSGTYIYKLSAGEFVQTKKMNLIK
ncbi:MAG: T9SS type A sorting domain-containing protein [Ignavibacteriaceae bacterium]|nr:T9SS type A sorting domain-containing protein [Ignavibacteriaceae bacterium]